MGEKALVYSDLQATDGHEACFSDRSQPLQWWRVHKFFEDITRIFEEEGCTYLWDLGDTTDDRTAIPLRTIECLLDGYSKFSYNDLNFKLIGNHEQLVKDTTIHAGKLFERVFSVYDGLSIYNDDQHDIRFVLAPYPENHVTLNNELYDILSDKTDRTVLLGHCSVTGAALNSTQCLDGIAMSLLKYPKLSLFGHIHKHQMLAPNAYYVGSPFQQNFGEAGDAKYVGIVDLDTLTVDWKKLEGYPSYKQVSYVTFESMPEDSEDRVKVVLETLDEAAAFYQHPLAHRVVSTVPRYTIKADDHETQGDVSKIRDTTDILRAWIKSMPFEHEGYSEDDLLEAGQALIDGDLE